MEVRKTIEKFKYLRVTKERETFYHVSPAAIQYNYFSFEIHIKNSY